MIYTFEFYNYIIKLKKQLNNRSPNTNKMIEEFKVDPYCKTLPSNYIDMSENVLDPPIYFNESSKKEDTNNMPPLPSDDTRVYFNKEFETLSNYTLPKRMDRDPRWHCIRDYMTCSTPTNFLDSTKRGLIKPSITVLNYQKEKRQKN